MATIYPDDPEPVRPRGFRNALILALFAFLIGALVMGWAFTRWAPARQFATDNAPATMPATASVPQVVAALPSAPLAAPAPVTATPDPAIDLRVGELEARIARVDLRAAAAAGNAGRAEGLLIAFAARRAIDRGTGLGYVEGQLRERFGAAQPRAVAVVIAAAQQPVTLAVLRQQLDAIAPTLAGAAPDEGWWQATQRTLATLIIVRREAAPSPAPDERLQRARLMIEGGQVDGALAEVARLPGAASATPWMTAAKRYIEAHRALDIIEAAAILPPPPGALPTATN